MQLTQTQSDELPAAAVAAARAVINDEYADDAQPRLAESTAEHVADGDVALAATSKPWYFAGGNRRPLPAHRSRKTHKRLAKLFPHENVWNDRITNQLMFQPPAYDRTVESQKYKTILLYNGLGPWNVKQGIETFANLKCPVFTCNLTASREAAHTADLVLYKDYFIPTAVMRPPKQLYMMYFLECPYHTQHVKYPDAFNWTATYR